MPYPLRYVCLMARKRKDLEPVDIAAADALLSAMKEAGISQRQVARESGMSLNRVGIILRKEPPPATKTVARAEAIRRA